ncbi:sensor histidine kinase [Pseudopedobacter beijingensis]|uniref:histidine kinase n=1 Tax=Pseudopedobacter beijingensis TaxID=1207056 RepID=A0ABW4IHR8_9SPHI
MERSKFNVFWNNIIGDKSDFELNTRVLHYVCVVGMIALLINIPLNYYIGFPFLTYALVVVLMGVFICYYLSRFLGKYDVSVVIFEITTTILVVLHFFFSSGINGAGLLYFLLAFFLTIVIAPRKQYLFWLMVNLILVITVLFIEYKYPYLIASQYKRKEERFYDLFIAYFITLILLLLLIGEIWKNYLREKNAYETRTRELAKLNEEKNKLFSIVAHDLRSPLASIQSYLESLSSISFSEEERNKINQSLLENTVAANEMMDNLLTWVKSQLDGLKPDLVRFALLENLKITLDVSATFAERKGINLSIAIDNSVTVTADKEILKVVIRNLVNNAIKFTNPGGYVDVKAINENGQCIISVTDSGVGISENDQKDMFSHRLKSKLGTKSEKGTALGLIICRDYTLLQKGKISLESKEGRGTTFYLTFPAW